MARRILVAVIAAVLLFLHAMPWIPGQHEPILFGALPITIALWAVWTLAVMATLWWIAYIYDPYAPIVRELDDNTDEDGVAHFNTSQPGETP